MPKSERKDQGPFCVWQGLDLPKWIELVRRRPPMAWSHWLRIGGVCATSCSNTAFGLLERLLFESKVRQTAVPAPVFIIGHWRSGTTLLHNLLSLDPNFVTPNLYHTVFPGHFLTTERILGPLTEPFLPHTRPMDDVPVKGWHIPQEDEIGICLLSLLSPYLMLAFPDDLDAYVRYLDLRTIPEAELSRWKQVFHFFLQKLMYRHPGKRLVLKSPSHSYRIPILLEMYPEARFVHIVSDPYRVMTSSLHLRRVAFSQNAFYSPSFDHIEDHVLHLYKTCFERLEEDLQLLEPHQLVEVRMEDLELDIPGELERIYAGLKLEGIERLIERVRPQLEMLRSHRKNEFALDPAMQKRLEAACPRVFDRYGYQRRDGMLDGAVESDRGAERAVPALDSRD